MLLKRNTAKQSVQEGLYISNICHRFIQQNGKCWQPLQPWPVLSAYVMAASVLSTYTRHGISVVYRCSVNSSVNVN